MKMYWVMTVCVCFRWFILGLLHSATCSELTVLESVWTRDPDGFFLSFIKMCQFFPPLLLAGLGGMSLSMGPLPGPDFSGLAEEHPILQDYGVHHQIAWVSVCVCVCVHHREERRRKDRTKTESNIGLGLATTRHLQLSDIYIFFFIDCFDEK